MVYLSIVIKSDGKDTVPGSGTLPISREALDSLAEACSKGGSPGSIPLVEKLASVSQGTEWLLRTSMKSPHSKLDGSKLLLLEAVQLEQAVTAPVGFKRQYFFTCS